MCGPDRLADHLVHIVAFGPTGGEVLDARTATMGKHHVGVLGLGPVKATEHLVGFSSFPR